MAISRINYSDTFNSSSSTNVSPKPTSTTTDDIMIAFVNVNVNGTSITPDGTYGWTLISNNQPVSGAQEAIYWRLATSSEPSTYTWTFGSTQRNRVQIITYRGVHTTSPINTYNYYATASGLPSTHDITTITPSVDNCLLVCMFGQDNQTSGITVTEPSGFTEFADLTATGAEWEASELQQTTASATGTVTLTSSVGTSGVAYLIALAPPAAGGSVIKTINGLVIASVKTVNGLAVASMKTINQVTNV